MNTCKHCNRIINNKGSLVAHQQCCDKNPNRIKHKHSKNAGAKKGSVPWNKGKKTGPALNNPQRLKNSEMFTQNSACSRIAIKKRIYHENLLDHRNCAICHISCIWHGQKMPLILDHINGINNDHRLKNLRLICSNCDSQLPTYKSKNRKSG